MKKTIYLHGENNADIKAVEIDELAEHPILKELFIKEFQIPGSHGEYLIYAQEDEFFPDGTEIITTEIELKHLGHVHFHRCKKINTQVTYNGRVEDFDFNPGVTVKKALKQIVHKFSIAPVDAAKLFLKTTNEVRLKSTDHIGSFASHDNCKLELLLVSEKLIEG
ncbi:MAG TPA: hypothetical protein VL442_14770 [Mucilaginibacter sp.]|jgi:hypothetical protein|nr:hypothetical protein [Mucilaginibacter sp.]